MDHAGRLAKVRGTMDRAGIGLLFLRTEANLFYLTGVRRQPPHYTDDNHYGERAVGAYIGPREVVLVVARMGSAYFAEETKGKPWITELRILKEGEDPDAVMAEAAKKAAGAGHGLATDNRAWAETIRSLRRLYPDAAHTLTSELLAAMRAIKDADELARMRRAAEITDDVHAHIVTKLKPGVTEFDIGHEIDYQFRVRGAEFSSFVTGIRFNRPGVPRLHETRATGRKLERGDSITFDYGCLYDGYCSDFGRTAFCGDPPADFVKMHDTVIAAQAAANAAVKAGQITAEGANAVARGVLRDAGYDAYFTHRLGHGIGMTVHESPFLDVNQKDVLQEHMTFTVEPSSRVPNGYACRVEDVVVVTPAGGVPLMKTPRTLTVVS
jgi:Xaa-Pro aminopeptidase